MNSSDGGKIFRLIAGAYLGYLGIQLLGKESRETGIIMPIVGVIFLIAAVFIVWNCAKSFIKSGQIHLDAPDEENSDAEATNEESSDAEAPDEESFDAEAPDEESSDAEVSNVESEALAEEEAASEVENQTCTDTYSEEVSESEAPDPETDQEVCQGSYTENEE